jgi:prepilin-type N-terminal cleavage/methylation domain-containing protein
MYTMTQLPFRWPKTAGTPQISATPSTPQAGFTLLESLVVVTLIALLAAIGLPSWLGFLDQRRVNMTQDSLYQALRSTQQDATTQRQQQQFSLRARDGGLEWASHPASVSSIQVAHWTPLIDGVTLASEDNTLLSQSGIYYIRFDHEGNVDGPRLGRITVVGAGGRLSHRCVVVSTLIGAMRRGQGHQKIQDERYCY